MNTTTQALIFAVVCVAGAASIGMGLAGSKPQPQRDVVQLERVVIVGHRTHADTQVALRVERLPRVVIEGRALRAADVQVASAGQARAL